MVSASRSTPTLQNFAGKPATKSTCGCRLRNALSTAASLLLTSSKGLTAVANRTGGGGTRRPMSSSRNMCSKDRPNSCVSSSASESNRSMSSRRLEQSSSSSHLQYISTRGSSCMQVVRIARPDGLVCAEWRRHTSCPAGKKQGGHFKHKQKTSTHTRHEYKNRA